MIIFGILIVLVVYYIGWNRGVQYGCKCSLLGMRKAINRNLIDECPVCITPVNFDVKLRCKEMSVKQYGSFIATKYGE